MGKDVWFYSISLEPEHDTSEVLSEYAKRYEVGPGWLFLTGQTEDIELLRFNLGFNYPSDPTRDADKSVHSRLLLMGNEPYDWWGTCPVASMGPTQITQLIRWLEPGARGLRP